VLVGSVVFLYLCGLAPLLSAVNAWRLARTRRWRDLARSGGSGGLDPSDLGDALDRFD
jgi:hypothetical protein